MEDIDLMGNSFNEIPIDSVVKLFKINRCISNFKQNEKSADENLITQLESELKTNDGCSELTYYI